MSIFRQILKALMDILAEIRLLRADADEIEKGVEELIKDQESQPTAIQVNFGKPKHK